MQVDMNQMMEQARQMQDRMMRLQEELGNREVTGEAGGGMAKVTLNGKGEMKSIDVANDLDPSDTEMFFDLIIAAHNDAKSRADKMVASETQRMMGEMGLPTSLDDVKGF